MINITEYLKINERGPAPKVVFGLDEYTYDEICDIIRDYVIDTVDDDNLKIIDVQLCGSRLRGDFKEDSDLDAVVEYEGPYKEDALFNILNDPEDEDNRLYIDDILVDINPITKHKSGTMQQYMKKLREYDMSKNTYNKLYKN